MIFRQCLEGIPSQLYSVEFFLDGGLNLVPRSPMVKCSEIWVTINLWGGGGGCVGKIHVRKKDKTKGK